MVESAHLARLSPPWRSATTPALRSACLGCVLGAVVLGAPLARVGSLEARAAVAITVLSTLGLSLYAWYRHVRTGRSLRHLLARVLAKANPELGAQALRAYALADQAERGILVGSKELAQAHFDQVIGKITGEELSAHVRRKTRAQAALGLCAASAALATALVGPGIVLEGIDVLAATDGRAPIPMRWLGAVEIEVRPPAYLRSSTHQLYGSTGNVVPTGSVVVVRGTPLRPGRKLVLTDGKREIPFTAHGNGGLSCEWELNGDTSLQIGARFGDVLIPEPDALGLAVALDAAPRVILEGAPRTLRLENVDSVELRYVASDDHGLMQVDLVLDRGETEERRLLDKLDGQSRTEIGSYVLLAEDRFLRDAFLPVTARIEARDTSERGGVVWGRSAEITLVPNAIGLPEASRYLALSNAIGNLVDAFAYRGSTADGRTLTARLESARQDLDRVADENYFGLDYGPGLKEFIKGQGRLIGRAPAGTASQPDHLKSAILALDVAMRRLSARDAQRVSVRLSRVAEAIAAAARERHRAERANNPAAYVAAASGALGAGIEQLVKLGNLGADLGGVARADHARLERARKRDDMTHVGFIATHIATRLGRPLPSFGSAAQGGVESGGSSVKPVDDASSDADARFDELAAELTEIATEHAGLIGDVEAALRRAASSTEAPGDQTERARRARDLRESVRDFPRVASDPATASGQAALAREHVEAMADALEQGDAEQALEQARDATVALRQAEGRVSVDFSDGPVAAEHLQEAAKATAAQTGFLEMMMEAQMRARQNLAREALATLGARERELSTRTSDLERRGHRSSSPLPEASLERLSRAAQLMQRAAVALERSEGNSALDLQQSAQQLLEQSDAGKTSEEPGERDGGSEDGTGRGHAGARNDGNVPDKDTGNRAQAFRQRVLDGLKRGRGTRLAPAVQRYAEELLQ